MLHRILSSSCEVIAEEEIPPETEPCKRLRLALESAVARGTSLHYANLYGTDLNGANLRGADLYGANLGGAYLRGAVLFGANLGGADMRGADLYGADLTGANLRAADLYGADLNGAYLFGADLFGADLTGAYLGTRVYVDGGTDRRGYGFWAICDENTTEIRTGCRSWRSWADARNYYGAGYDSDGDREECLARLALMEAQVRARLPGAAS